MIITISGVSGSGKSTVAESLAQKLKYRHYSIGELQREIAREKGLSILELGELEKHDPSIDRMIDERQSALGKREDNFVIDSWLGAHFIPHSFKVLLLCGLKVRAGRIFSAERGRVEKYTSISDTQKKIRKRDSVNQERWLKFYGFDYLDRKNYDLVINTGNKTIDEIVSIVQAKISREHRAPSQ